jgi:hypothetical protein
VIDLLGRNCHIQDPRVVGRSRPAFLLLCSYLTATISETEALRSLRLSMMPVKYRKYLAYHISAMIYGYVLRKCSG